MAKLRKSQNRLRAYEREKICNSLDATDGHVCDSVQPLSTGTWYVCSNGVIARSTQFSDRYAFFVPKKLLLNFLFVRSTVEEIRVRFALYSIEALLSLMY